METEETTVNMETDALETETYVEMVPEIAAAMETNQEIAAYLHRQR